MEAVGRFIIVRKDTEKSETESGLYTGRSPAYVIVSIGAQVSINLARTQKVRLCSDELKISLGDNLYAVRDDDVVGVV